MIFRRALAKPSVLHAACKIERDWEWPRGEGEEETLTVQSVGVPFLEV